MRTLIRTVCLAAAVTAGQIAAGPPTSSATTGRATRPATQPARAPNGLADLTSFDGAAVPVTPPSTDFYEPPAAPKPRLPAGLIDLKQPRAVEKDAAGQWWTVSHPRVERLYLLPCELLEAAEKVLAARPAARLRLSGEVHHYGERHYLLLTRVRVVQPDATAHLLAATKPAPKTAKAPPATKPAPTTAASLPASPSAHDVAQELLGQPRAKPVVPTITTAPARPTPSVAPASVALKPGPGRMILNRLTRLRSPANQRWRLLVFESDNTLREPPLRILPNEHLKAMEALSRGGAAAGALFHVSGEVHRYKGHDYVLLRGVNLKRDMDQF